MSNLNQIEKLDNNEEIYVRKRIEFLIQLREKNKVLEILKKNFKIEGILVISKKEEDDI